VKRSVSGGDTQRWCASPDEAEIGRVEGGAGWVGGGGGGGGCGGGVVFGWCGGGQGWGGFVWGVSGVIMGCWV